MVQNSSVTANCARCRTPISLKPINSRWEMPCLSPALGAARSSGSLSLWLPHSTPWPPLRNRRHNGPIARFGSWYRSARAVRPMHCRATWRKAFNFANGQPLIVENRAGAGGTLAAAAVAREKPDGYTLFLAEVGPNAVSHTLGKLPYDPHTAFTPIIHVANLPAVVLIRPTLPYTTLAEYIAAAKKQPGKFNYASAGMGNWTHLFMAYLNSQAGIDQVNVVYRSGAEMLTALLRNDADTAIITVSTSLGQIKEGKIRALAGTSMRPIPQVPETPPVGQTIPGFDVTVWHGIVGPAGYGCCAGRAHQWDLQSGSAGSGGAQRHHGHAGCRHRRRHTATIRRLHQERA